MEITPVCFLLPTERNDFFFKINSRMKGMYLWICFPGDKIPDLITKCKFPVMQKATAVANPGAGKFHTIQGFYGVNGDTAEDGIGHL
jgi:hypothetical protein